MAMNNIEKRIAELKAIATVYGSLERERNFHCGHPEEDADGNHICDENGCYVYMPASDSRRDDEYGIDELREQEKIYNELLAYLEKKAK